MSFHVTALEMMKISCNLTSIWWRVRTIWSL